MDDIIPNADIRLQQAARRIGSQKASCVVCGEHDLRCIEMHHLAGQHFHDELQSVCRNCHRKLSDVQRDHPVQIGMSASLPEIVGHYLLGLADMLVLVAKTLANFAAQLIDMARPPVTGGAQ